MKKRDHEVACGRIDRIATGKSVSAEVPRKGWRSHLGIREERLGDREDSTADLVK